MCFAESPSPCSSVTAPDVGLGEGSLPQASKAAGSAVSTQRSASTSAPSTQL